MPNATQLRETLQEFLEALSDLEGWHVESVRSFEEAGIMTRSEGLVVRYSDGSEFRWA